MNDDQFNSLLAMLVAIYFTVKANGFEKQSGWKGIYNFLAAGAFLFALYVK